MTKEEKEDVCMDITDLIEHAEKSYKMKSLKHIEGALMDRIIEIKNGEWDEQD